MVTLIRNQFQEGDEVKYDRTQKRSLFFCFVAVVVVVVLAAAMSRGSWCPGCGRSRTSDRGVVENTMTIWYLL